MFSLGIFIYLFVTSTSNIIAGQCGSQTSLPMLLKSLLANTPVVGPSNLPTVACGCPVKPCFCPETKCGCPKVPACGCFSTAIGFPNPLVGVQTCAFNNPYGPPCGCNTPVLGNFCARSTPAVGLATSCGCGDPPVRIVDGCPNARPVYSYNLPSLGVPTCSCSPFGLTCGCGGYLPCGCGLCPPGLSCGCNLGAPCGCSGPCGCNLATACGCSGPCGCNLGASCGCSGPCGCNLGAPCGCGGSCGCVEVPCGCPSVKTTCTCVTPTVETPCGSAPVGPPKCSCVTTVDQPTCGCPLLPPFSPVLGCSRYLRQVVINPPCM